MVDLSRLQLGRATQGETCTTCKREFARLQPSGLCGECDTKARLQRRDAEVAQRRAEEIAGQLANLDARLDQELAAAGISKRERQGAVEKIDPELKRSLPTDAVLAMLAGEVPADGWGIFGTTGNGKSLCMSAILKRHAHASLEKRIREGSGSGIDWIRWESVPELVDWLRDHARSEPERVEQRIHAACTCQVLVLDDLAAERRISDYGSDYAIGKLDLIVDARYREMLPTWYTANVVDEAGLLAAYGARFVSRLCGSNPPVVAVGADRRLGG